MRMRQISIIYHESQLKLVDKRLGRQNVLAEFADLAT